MSTEQNIILFWKSYPFSQWSPSKFIVDDIKYSNTEQYMMAEKARLFKDYDIEKKIMNTTTPAVMKALGRKIANFDQSVWDQYKYQIVVCGNYAKFSQNSNIKQILLDTGDAIIAEASPYDKIWGIGLLPTHKDAQNPNKWKGENLLGKALMEVRSKLKS